MADLDGLECNKISNCSVLLNHITESQLELSQYGGELTPPVVPLEDEGCCARIESVEGLCGEVWDTDGRGDKVILVKEELNEESSSSGISEGEEGIWERSRAMGAEGSSVVDKEAEGSDSGLGSEDLPLPGPPLPVPLDRKSTLKRCRLIDPADVAGVKKAKRSIAFGDVSVYYFQRTQGFTCVPSQGGSTLGMQLNHSDRQTFSLTEHVWEQRRAHKQMLAAVAASPTPLTAPTISSSSSSSSDSDTDEHNTESELDPDNYFFLQPVPTRQRRALLRAAGVRKIDSIEKDECRDIRSSREFCGCSCKGFCDPDTCACSQAGIKCQVDRLNFPCGCTHDGCANSNGRIEFNPMRVRTHFIHTMMRIEMEKKREQEEEEARRSELAGFREEASYTNYPFESGYGYSGANPGYQNTHSPPANGYHYEGVPGFHQYESFQGNFRYPEEKVESFSELLQGSRYPQNDLEEIPTGVVPNPEDTNDGGGGGDKSAEENFGEIIKKTMVESVTA